MPLVGMPLFAEQPDNIARAIDRGFALSVSVKKLDTLAIDLEQAIRRVMKEPSFAVNAAKVSHLMKAHRETPAQLAASKSAICSMQTAFLVFDLFVLTCMSLSRQICMYSYL